MASDDFVLILVDGERYIFQDHFINRGPANGGIAAAKEFREKISLPHTKDLHGVQIIVRVYADLDRITDLVDTGEVEPEGQQLAVGCMRDAFSSYLPLMDLVTSTGSYETILEKIISTLALFGPNASCKRIILLADPDQSLIQNAIGRTATTAKITFAEPEDVKACFRYQVLYQADNAARRKLKQGLIPLDRGGNRVDFSIERPAEKVWTDYYSKHCLQKGKPCPSLFNTGKCLEARRCKLDHTKLLDLTAQCFRCVLRRTTCPNRGNCRYLECCYHHGGRFVSTWVSSTDVWTEAVSLAAQIAESRSFDVSAEQTPPSMADDSTPAAASVRSGPSTPASLLRRPIFDRLATPLQNTLLNFEHRTPSPSPQQPIVESLAAPPQMIPSEIKVPASETLPKRLIFDRVATPPQSPQLFSSTRSPASLFQQAAFDRVATPPQTTQFDAEYRTPASMADLSMFEDPSTPSQNDLPVGTHEASATLPQRSSVDPEPASPQMAQPDALPRDETRRTYPADDAAEIWRNRLQALSKARQSSSGAKPTAVPAVTMQPRPSEDRPALQDEDANKASTTSSFPDIQDRSFYIPQVPDAEQAEKATSAQQEVGGASVQPGQVKRTMYTEATLRSLEKGKPRNESSIDTKVRQALREGRKERAIQNEDVVYPPTNSPEPEGPSQIVEARPSWSRKNRPYDGVALLNQINRALKTNPMAKAGRDDDTAASYASSVTITRPNVLLVPEEDEETATGYGQPSPTLTPAPERGGKTTSTQFPLDSASASKTEEEEDLLLPDHHPFASIKTPLPTTRSASGDRRSSSLPFLWPGVDASPRPALVRKQRDENRKPKLAALREGQPDQAEHNRQMAREELVLLLGWD